MKVTGNDLYHAAGAWTGARLDEDEGQVVKDAGMERATYFVSGWMRNSSDPSINCHE